MPPTHRPADFADALQQYVPGYQLKQDVHFRKIEPTDPADDLVPDKPVGTRWVITILLEVMGAAHYLPAYAGNLDIMTSAALRSAEQILKVVSVA